MAFNPSVAAWKSSTPHIRFLSPQTSVELNQHVISILGALPLSSWKIHVSEKKTCYYGPVSRCLRVTRFFQGFVGEVRKSFNWSSQVKKRRSCFSSIGEEGKTKKT